MFEIFGKFYYIDVENLTHKCSMQPAAVDENGKDILEINLFKYEIVKMCLERILNEFGDDNDDEIDKLIKNEQDTSSSFKFAFNTLLKYEILIEESYD
jgi:hypothetical protein